MEKHTWWPLPRYKVRTIIFSNNLFADLLSSYVHGRTIYFDNSAQEIMLRYFPSLMQLVVNDIWVFASERMKLNHKNANRRWSAFLNTKDRMSTKCFLLRAPLELHQALNSSVYGYPMNCVNTHVDIALKKVNSRLYPLHLSKNPHVLESVVRTFRMDVSCKFLIVATWCFTPIVLLTKSWELGRLWLAEWLTSCPNLISCNDWTV